MHSKLSFTALLASACVVSARYHFQPETRSTYINNNIPPSYNLSTNQYANDGTSYWLSGFLTDTNHKQYVIISHVLTFTNTNSVCRSSILELDTLEYTTHSDKCPPVSATTDKSIPFDTTLNDYKFGSTSADSISSMYVVGGGPEYSFNLSTEASTAVLLDGGVGEFAFAPSYVTTTEWGLPACRVEGSLTINNKEVEIDPEHSQGWYDRQFITETPKNWTWFEVNFPGSKTKGSLWAYDMSDDPADGTYSFGSVRVGDNSLYNMAFTLETDWNHNWTSPASNRTYPLSWRLNFETGDHLLIESVRPDQEIYNASYAGAVYEGFVTVKGSFLGSHEGYGIVEIN